MVEQLELVQKLVEKGCKVYGSSKCGFCKKQIALFTDEKAKKLFLEKVYQNVQDMKEKPKINGFPTLVCGDKKYSGFKTLEQLEEFVKKGSFPELVKKDLTCEQKLAGLEYKVKRRGFDFWVYAGCVKVIPGKKGLKDKIIFSKIRSCSRYQVYNEFNKELNKDRVINKLTPCELNKQLNNSLGPNWIPTCYMEYERCCDNKLRSFAFDLETSKYCNGKLIFEVNLSHLDGNPEYLTRLNKPETGHHVACNIDEGGSNRPCNQRMNSGTCEENFFCKYEKTYCCKLGNDGCYTETARYCSSEFSCTTKLKRCTQQSYPCVPVDVNTS
jgi:hypothetical protein